MKKEPTGICARCGKDNFTINCKRCFPLENKPLTITEKYDFALSMLLTQKQIDKIAECGTEIQIRDYLLKTIKCK